jgi:hypothetical protein
MYLVLFPNQVTSRSRQSFDIDFGLQANPVYVF